MLDEKVVTKIAAGEVIERPASIVKELVENCIDAFAKHIRISISKGGIDLIQIQDDGIGIPEKELTLAVQKNSTSKIQTERDLFDLHTLGFRGEALASIASVSCFEISSRYANQSSAMKLQIQGGVTKDLSPSSLSEGTLVRVQDLFFNTPARKKFLKSPHTEFSHIEKTVKKLALAHPHIAFDFDREGETIFSLKVQNSYLDRIVELYPEGIQDKLLPITGSLEGMSVHGFVSNSKLSFSTSKEIWTFINGRWVQDRMLQKAIMEGYRTALMEHRYPMAFLFIDVAPDSLDVNVHPNKSEVRFSNHNIPFRLLSSSIVEKLKKPYPQYQNTKGPVSFFKEGSNPAYNSAKSFQQTLSSNQTFHSPHKPASIWTQNSTVDVDATQVSLEAPTLGYFSSLRFISQVDHTFLVLTDEKKLILIDQHAAHERVQFERLQKLYGSHGKYAQQLLTPIQIDLSVSEIEALTSIKDFLYDLGFEVECFDENTAMIRSTPELLGQVDPSLLVQDLIDQYMEDPEIQAWKDKMDQIFSTMACHSAVRAHDILTQTEVHHLLHEMDRIDLGSYCPHGRPTFIELGVSDLEKAFKRK